MRPRLTLPALQREHARAEQRARLLESRGAIFSGAAAHARALAKSLAAAVAAAQGSAA